MALSDVEHFFVLMLENRSFDHLLGLSNIKGTCARTGQPATIDGITDKKFLIKNRSGEFVQIDGSSPRADRILRRDVPHEFINIKRQLLGPGHENSPYTDADITMDGFLADRDGTDPTMDDPASFAWPSDVRVLTTLATQFVVCDRWFSSLPGPTYPNRMFAHAATSGGNPDSPSNGDMVRGVITGNRFKNGHIFGRLRQKRVPWAIYAHDLAENMSIMLEGVSGTDIREFNRFKSDLQASTFAPKYVFIEPYYDAILSDYSRGNSMHPVGDMLLGELLIKDVYEAIRGSALWERSALIVLFDEHGGFFDHVPPPAAPAPGDGAKSQRFDFQRLGARVPAVIASPLIPANRVDSTVYDHTSIIRTLSERFNLGTLTARDASASSFGHLFTLTEARRDAPLHMPTPARSASAASFSEPQEPEPGPADLPPSLPPSAATFVLATAMARAKKEGPTAWEHIHARVKSLDFRSRDAVLQFVSESRSAVAPTAVGPQMFDSTDGEGPEPVDRAAAERALTQYSGDAQKAAWCLGISQAELCALVPATGADDEAHTL